MDRIAYVGCSEHTSHPLTRWATRLAILLGVLAMCALPALARGGDRESDDFNVRRKAEIMDRVRITLTRYKGYQFDDWMSCGSYEAYRARVYASDVQVYIDREYLDPKGTGRGDEAAYVDSYLPKQYVNDFIFRTEPRFIEPILIWHEVIHAISDDKELFTFNGGNENDTDHHYIEWAEAILVSGLPALAKLEDLMKKHGKAVPPDATLQEGQALWKQFLLAYNRRGLAPIPNKDEQLELKRTSGFYCDPELIRDRYLGLGYPAEYFSKPILMSFFPNKDFDVVIHPGERVKIQVRVVEMPSMKPPKEGQVRFEYTMQGIQWDIGTPQACPAPKTFFREWSPTVSDPTEERVFPIRVTYDYGHRKMPGSPFVAGKVTVVPWTRTLGLKVVEKGQPTKGVANAKVTIRGVPKAYDEVHPQADGRIKLRTPRDRATGEEARYFDPLDWVHAITTQIPDPRQHLVRYYGAYANRVRRIYREAEQEQEQEQEREAPGSGAPPAIEDLGEAEEPAWAKARRRSWARLLKRIYTVDPLACPGCGHELRVVAAITDPAVIDRILAHRNRRDLRSPFEPRAPPAA